MLPYHAYRVSPLMKNKKGEPQSKKTKKKLYDCQELCHILALGFAVSNLKLRKVVMS